MADRAEADAWLKAFQALPKRNRVVLIIAALGGTIIAVTLLVSVFFWSGLVGGQEYPESHLSLVQEQYYRLREYDVLPTTIQFPGTDYFMNVGGNMIAESEDGASFYFDEHTVLAVSVGKTGEDYEEAIDTRYPPLLKQSGKISYSEKKTDAGFMNKIYFEYHVGILDIGRVRYYVVSYVHPTESGELLYLSALTDSRNGLRSGRNTLNKMIETLGVDSAAESTGEEKAGTDSQQ